VQIGPYKLANQVALAPMAGVTDLPFRRLCAELGTGLVVSEMINSDPSLRNTQKTRWRSCHDQEIEPRSVQIAGNDPQRMAQAARYNVGRGAQIIDINMGCPAKKVCRKAAGSALLADEPLVERILDAVVNAVDVPVTLKIRTGTAPDKRNGARIAQIAQNCGIAALAVHGRTRACAFKGQVEYDTIADIVAVTDLPVFANGDIDSPAVAREVLRRTGAAGVMIGRAAQGRPWLPGQIATYLKTGIVPAEPSLDRQLEIIQRHTSDLHAFYGEFMGVRIARKHVGWYLQAFADGSRQRKLFNGLTSPRQQMDFLHRLLNSYSNKDIAA